MNSWYKELPEGFKQVYMIDAENKKTARKMTLIGLIVSIVTIVPFGIDFFSHKNSLSTENFPLIYFGFVIALFLYLILHELVHGIVYKIITHQKLTFGLTLYVAFCGVPQLYVKRSAMFFAILAPFAVFNIVFITALVVLEKTVAWYFLALLFALHIGGCSGDLWGTIYMATHCKNKTMFVNDTGPKQTFYVQD